MMKRGKNIVMAVLAVALTAVLVYGFASPQGFIRLSQMVHRRNDLRTRVQDLERTNAVIAREIDLLRSDEGTIEDLARTRLGMVRSGEIVYIFPEKGEDAGK